MSQGHDGATLDQPGCGENKHWLMLTGAFNETTITSLEKAMVIDALCMNWVLVPLVPEGRSGYTEATKS